LILLAYVYSLRRIIFAIVAISSSIVIPVHSQNVKRIDSLKIILNSSRDTTRFKILVELFKATNRYDYEIALEYARQAFYQASILGDSARIVEGGRMMAYSLDDLGRRDEAIKILENAIAVGLRNQDRYSQLKPILKFLYNNAALIYMDQGKYDSSLSYHFKSLELRERESDRKYWLSIFQNTKF
jgi:tetratricopeptide (TPR) repeat protein